ncbi:MAG TPA: isomerizing glutamine--fructose-6-phosphate transaminase [Candidatus Sulfotelmatobacter sp.]|jgi:glucosamine--fructose-6-phosphate aminotransferase (isomerizing)|nr:isomerizing glutamine--fructose-6-phosphate transaminase [Candidatus Sulfotelmatobacter sp.]
MKTPNEARKNAGSNEHSHAMRREIYEQPVAIEKTIAKHLKDDIIFPGELDAIESALLTFEKVIIAASGSSRHAGLAGEIMIEDLSGVPVDVEYASEYCYRSTHAAVDPIVMVITQSGETADTMAAQREALTRGMKTIAISNRQDTTITREAGAALITGAGPELSVPATKSFTTQVTILYLMALFLARKRGRMTSEVSRAHLQQLKRLPEAIENNLAPWDRLAEEFGAIHFKAEKFLYLGRGVHYAIAREGALKLKEISYAHAEGYPAGELKHGPNALVDDKLPVVVLASRDDVDPDSVLRYRRTLDVMKEVKSRRGPLVAVATEGDKEVAEVADHVFYVPAAPELLLPILEVIPLQLFAYHVAVNKGYDVDHPRNLTKAVLTE